MAFKFIVLTAFLAVARAGVVDYAAAPVAYATPVAKAVVAAPAATSHSSITQHTVAHAEPTVVKYAAAPAVHQYAVPEVKYAQYSVPQVKYAVPEVKYAQYSVPQVKYAVPEVKYAQYSVPQVKYAAAPVAQYAAVPQVKYAAAPVVQYAAAPVAKTLVAEQYAPAHYDFEYAVHDPHTGDVKSQKESRQGDAVHGSYSLVEADGSKRVVEYTADAHNGFNAVVHREPAQHGVAVKAVAAAPVVKYAAAPVAYAHAAPAVQYAAPVAKYAAAPAAYSYYHH